jgi:hypothetical protein
MIQDTQEARKAPEANGFQNPADYFEAVHRAFQQAERSSGRGERFDFQVAGQKIRLRFASPALISQLTLAFAHLPGWQAGEPDLTVCIWDSATTGVNMPLPPWSGGAYHAQGREFKFEEGRVRYHDGQIQMFFYMDEHAMLLDRRSRIGIFWVPEAEMLSYHESGAPLRTLFHWWFSNSNQQFVHAAAVGLPEGGVLMAGRGGSGKSTSTLACLDSPLLLASDDYCLLRVAPEPRAYSLYNTAKIAPNSLALFPELESRISNPQKLAEEKALFFLEQHFPEKLILDFPLRGLLIPRVTGRATTKLEPASAVEGLKALAPSTIFQLSDEGHQAFQVMSRFVKQVPCYTLLLGTELEQIPETILRLLSEKG